MPCPTCDTIQTIVIRTPDELRVAGAYCRRLVNEGRLTPTEDPERHADAWTPAWGEFREQGPWEDIVRYFFACPACGQHYRMHCDTYHGSGGRFSRYEP